MTVPLNELLALLLNAFKEDFLLLVTALITESDFATSTSTTVSTQENEVTAGTTVSTQENETTTAISKDAADPTGVTSSSTNLSEQSATTQVTQTKTTMKPTWIKSLKQVKFSTKMHERVIILGANPVVNLLRESTEEF